MHAVLLNSRFPSDFRMATGPTTCTSQPSEEKHILKPKESREKKKSWTELKSLVNSTRRQQTSLANRVPSEFTFVQKEVGGRKATRLYFLGVPPGNRENTLLYTNLEDVIHGDGQDSEASDELRSANWKPLLVSFRGLFFSSGFSKEEQLLRERKRLGSLGITAYEYHRQSSKFLFQACGSVFTCLDAKFENQPVRPREIISYSITGTRIDCKLCPSDSDLIAFIHNKNIWVTNVQVAEDTQLTYTHTGLPEPAKDPKSAGVASYIIQEEFDRYSGYWWQPSGTESGRKKVHRILYEEVDESEVELMHINHQGFDDSTDYFRYPRAGTSNAKVTLKVVEFEINEEGRICNIVWKRLLEDLQSVFPWMEYIVRIDWTPDGKYVWLQLLNRSQQSTSLVLIPLSSFVLEDYFLNDPMEVTSDPTLYVIYEEHSDIWINVHDCLHFFPQTNPEEISFLWASEATLIRQLYYITAQLQKVEMVPGNLKPSLLQFHQLTHQEAEVLPKQLWVDEERQLVFYKALHDTPLEEHIYVISYLEPQRPIRLTPPGFNIHDAQFSPDFSYLVYNMSNLTTAQFCMIAQLEITSRQPLSVTCHDISKLMHLSTATLSSMPQQPEPEIFSYQSPTSRETMYGVIIKPVNFDPNKMYPVVHYVYGGPQVQLVSNSFQGMRALRLCPHLGYVVVMLDNRGSSKRGLRFEGYIKHKLGICELEDQVEGLKWIAGQKGYLDLSRVAVHGWSYGGYLSLLALAKKPDVYKLAVVGAPVTNWNSYDTGYTERYMDTPSNNANGYQDSSVLNMTKLFPDEENRLLLIHGMIDENVHFHHTSQLIDKLVKDCKPYQLLVYPQERHGIRKPDTYEHYETSILSWLQQHL